MTRPKKTSNKQQKHDLVNCPPISEKMAAQTPKIGIFEKLKKKWKGTLHGDHLTQKTWLYTISKKFPMGGQAQNNNFHNPQKCGHRGV